MKYEIRAEAKAYHEMEVDEQGKMTYSDHQFEGYDFIAYRIINLDTLDVEEDDIKTFEEAKELLKKLNK